MQIGHTEAFVKVIILEDDPGFRVAGCKSSSPDLDLSISHVVRTSHLIY